MRLRWLETSEAHSNPLHAEPFETGLDTHTVPLGGARVRNLNRYLKALETKERKTERAALRGQERKIGVGK